MLTPQTARVAAGAQAVRDMIVEAWLGSDNTSVGYGKRSSCDSHRASCRDVVCSAISNAARASHLRHQICITGPDAEQFNEGELAHLSWNNDVDVELNEHVRHRKAGDDEAGAAGRDAVQVACDGIVDRFAVRAVQ